MPIPKKCHKVKIEILKQRGYSDKELKGFVNWGYWCVEIPLSEQEWKPIPCQHILKGEK